MNCGERTVNFTIDQLNHGKKKMINSKHNEGKPVVAERFI